MWDRLAWTNNGPNNSEPSKRTPWRSLNGDQRHEPLDLVAIPVYTSISNRITSRWQPKERCPWCDFWPYYNPDKSHSIINKVKSCISIFRDCQQGKRNTWKKEWRA